MNKSKLGKVLFTICGLLIPLFALLEVAIIIFTQELIVLIISGGSCLIIIFILVLLTYSFENMMIRYCYSCNHKLKRNELEIKLDSVQQFGKKNSFSYVYTLKGKCPNCQNYIEHDLFIKAKSEDDANIKLEKRLNKIFKGEKND